LKANINSSKKQEGKVEDAKYLTIDGVRGAYSLSAAGNAPYSSRIIRRKGYRKFQGRPQLLSVLVKTSEKNYWRDREVMRQVLNSVKFTD